MTSTELASQYCCGYCLGISNRATNFYSSLMDCDHLTCLDCIENLLKEAKCTFPNCFGKLITGKHQIIDPQSYFSRPKNLNLKVLDKKPSTKKAHLWNFLLNSDSTLKRGLYTKFESSQKEYKKLFFQYCIFSEGFVIYLSNIKSVYRDFVKEFEKRNLIFTENELLENYLGDCIWDLITFNIEDFLSNASNFKLIRLSQIGIMAFDLRLEKISGLLLGIIRNFSLKNANFILEKVFLILQNDYSKKLVINFEKGFFIENLKEKKESKIKETDLLLGKWPLESFNIPKITVQDFFETNEIKQFSKKLNVKLKNRHRHFLFLEFQRKKIKSDLLIKDSLFLRKRHLSFLVVIFPKLESSSLLVSMTEEKDSAKIFHEKCDEQGPTVCFIKSGDYLVGGYNDKTWKWEGRKRFESSTSAFLFSLNRKIQYKIQDSKITEAVSCEENFGPFFGGFLKRSYFKKVI